MRSRWRRFNIVEDLIAEENIACEYTRAGHIEAAWKNSHFKHYRHEQEVLAREFNHPVHAARSRPAAGRTRHVNYYHGLLIDERSGALHPAQYVRGLAICASGSGALLFEKTPATQIMRDGTWLRRGDAARHHQGRKCLDRHQRLHRRGRARDCASACFR